MATADEILAAMAEEAAETEQAAEVCTIDRCTREITIPEALRIVGVETDNEVTIRKFKVLCSYRGTDLSPFHIRVHFMNANQERDVYYVTDAASDGEYLTFSWVISRKAAAFKGKLKFIVCMVCDGATDGEREWNSTLGEFTVLEGLEVKLTEDEEAQARDAITKLLLVIDAREGEAVEAVNAEGATQVAAVQAAGTNQVGIIAAKGKETLATIPDNYTELYNYVNPLPHISNRWSIHNHRDDFFVLEHNATTPTKAYLDTSKYAFGVMNVYPGRTVYRDGVVDALFQKCTYMFEFVSVGAFEFGTRDGNGENQGLRCVVNPKYKTFKIYHSDWQNNDEIKRNLTIGFDILAGEVYTAEIEKYGLHQTVIRLACTTDASKTFAYTHTATGDAYNNKLRCWGGVTFHAIESTAEVKLYEMAQKVCVDDKYDLLIIGDSFVECGTIEMESSKGFAYLARERMGEKCSASGHGGATTAQLITRLDTDANVGLYKYAFLQVGSNDSATGVTVEQFKTNMSTIIDFIKSKGAVPILTTIPIRTDADNTAFIEEANAWVKASGYKYVDEYAMITSAHVLQDGIHPNETGHALILLSLMGLAPECF